MNTSMVNSASSVIIDPAKQRPYNQTINEQGWFTGSVVTYDLKCPNIPDKSCDDILTLHNHVEYNTTVQLNLSNPVDIYNDHISGNIYYLSHTHLIILNDELQLITKPIYLDVDPPSHCLRLIPQTLTVNNQLRLAALYAVCFEETQQEFIVIPISLLNPDIFPGQPVILQKTTNFGDASIIDNKLFVLSLGLGGTTSDTSTLGSVFVYNLNLTGEPDQALNIIQTFNGDTLGFTRLNITAFNIEATELQSFR